jgi:GNAT superfamily N-acetyltransferase
MARMIAPTDDPRVAEFMNALDRINAIADRAPGFVWRLQTEEGNATSIQHFPDPLQLVNLSVWETADDLKAYAYRSEHVDFFRRRSEWFDSDSRRLALWWIPAGTQPELAEAVRRVEFLERHGPSPYAFSFRRPAEPLLVESKRLDDPVAVELVSALDAELDVEYQTESMRRAPDQQSATDDARTLLVASLAGRPVACGSVRRTTDTIGEITRVYVVPDARGDKIGAAVLDRLEAVAVRLGLTELVVEIGVRQHAAIGLHRNAGYTRTESWRLESRAAGVAGLAYRKTLTPSD